MEVAAARRQRSQWQCGGGSAAAAAASLAVEEARAEAAWQRWRQRGVDGGSKDASGDVLEEEMGGRVWRSLSSWGVEFLIEFREPLTWGDVPRGGRSKAKTEAKAMLMAAAGQTVARGGKETM